ncbi:MAG: hypothetical protein A2081_03060 [Elusimicrobia bacterium GWC2_61_19]|nr:MAG: hypothetical protein A2081_03060 [Elusimicrobia bacterium GWC2_61_19]
MNKKWTGVLALAAFFLLSGGFYYLRAQGGGMPEGMGGGPRGGGNKQPMEMLGGMGMMGGMGGGAAMVVYDKYIYVLSGGTLFKVEPTAMKVEKQVSLKPKMPARPAQQWPGGGEDQEPE